MYDRCSAWSWYTFQWEYPDRLRCRCHITQSLGDVLPVGAPSTLWGNVHGKNLVLRRFSLTETTGHLRICMHEFILFHTWILMADMCFIVFLCVFSRACLLRTWVPYVLILAYSGCFLRKMRFTCFSWCFFVITVFFACQYMSVSFGFCLFCFPIRPPSHRVQARLCSFAS